MERVLRGDADAFEQLVVRHRDAVFRIVARHVPRDRVAEVSHEAFVAAWRSLSGYEGSRPFAHWLSRVALRAACDHWRREERARRGTAPAGEALPDPVDGSRPAHERTEQREELERALARLAVDERLALTLVHLEGLSVAEAAALLGWSESKVKVRAHRGRERLRDLAGLPRGQCREPRIEEAR